MQLSNWFFENNKGELNLALADCAQEHLKWKSQIFVPIGPVFRLNEMERPMVVAVCYDVISAQAGIQTGAMPACAGIQASLNSSQTSFRLEPNFLDTTYQENLHSAKPHQDFLNSGMTDSNSSGPHCVDSHFHGNDNGIWDSNRHQMVIMSFSFFAKCSSAWEINASVVS